VDKIIFDINQRPGTKDLMHPIDFFGYMLAYLEFKTPPICKFYHLIVHTSRQRHKTIAFLGCLYYCNMTSNNSTNPDGEVYSLEFIKLTSTTPTISSQELARQLLQSSVEKFVFVVHPLLRRRMSSQELSPDVLMPPCYLPLQRSKGCSQQDGKIIQ
jgi:hypothetical protein